MGGLNSEFLENHMEFLAGNTGLPVKSFRHENTLMQLAEYFRHKCFMPEGIPALENYG